MTIKFLYYKSWQSIGFGFAKDERSFKKTRAHFERQGFTVEQEEADRIEQLKRICSEKK